MGIFDRDVYVYCRPMPAQTSAPGQLSIVPQTRVTTDYSGVVCSIAKDADGDWWDLVTGMRLRETPDSAWVDAKLTSAGVALIFEPEAPWLS